jgi:hypothetical protein
MDDLTVLQKDVAGQGHSLGELALNHRCLASWVEDLAVASGKRGTCPPILVDSRMLPLRVVLRVCLS